MDQEEREALEMTREELVRRFEKGEPADVLRHPPAVHILSADLNTIIIESQLFEQSAPREISRNRNAKITA